MCSRRYSAVALKLGSDIVKLGSVKLGSVKLGSDIVKLGSDMTIYSQTGVRYDDIVQWFSKRIFW